MWRFARTNISYTEMHIGLKVHVVTIQVRLLFHSVQWLPWLLFQYSYYTVLDDHENTVFLHVYSKELYIMLWIVSGWRIVNCARIPCYTCTCVGDHLQTSHQLTSVVWILCLWKYICVLLYRMALHHWWQQHNSIGLMLSNSFYKEEQRVIFRIRWFWHIVAHTCKNVW